MFNGIMIAQEKIFSFHKNHKFPGQKFVSTGPKNFLQITSSTEDLKFVMGIFKVPKHEVAMVSHYGLNLENFKNS